MLLNFNDTNSTYNKNSREEGMLNLYAMYLIYMYCVSVKFYDFLIYL